ncbi:hypothetical protein ACSFA8_25325 [Variovorax sp. RT4R15]|uniref:hypothetical protein n=1 Tax=Variovorax sp. RT4R15 TaxID=3443737 RepID=UPI003F477C84
MNDSRLKTLLTVLPVLSAGLYLFGATYLQGYLNAFGVDDSMFPASIDRLLFSGFIALVTFGLVPYVYAFLAMLALVAAVLIAAVLSSVPRVQRWQTILTKKVGNLRSDRKPSPVVNALLDKGETIYVYALGTFAIALLLVLLVVLSSRTGKEQAEREIDSFSQGKGNYVQLLADMTPMAIKAKQVICGATHCAFWTGNETIILRHEQVKQIAAHADAAKPPEARRSATAP